ncbi:FAD-dependent oxidoreductase [Rhizobium sp. 1AS11]|uniref:FAD-dependent oxidoreductase n=1 Tax=Rhizobium acaciae TaxID=2989736 RepID=UPI002221F073|nr:FAD-dependent oxidoreductase [Rhizobium acaciae]MCW1412178.1 FAD-dependent oxidoreductase [Rhizobium acaciae]MCW1744193.1 FAD-dependent oxidoreductase [Rhizobium acaciae]
MGMHIGPGSAFSLGLASSLRRSGGVLPGLAPYTFEVETENLVAAFATPPSVGDKRTRNRFIKRLKKQIDGSSVWSKAKMIMALGADENSSLRWWNDPSRTATKIGTPTFNASFGWTATANGQALNTGLLANELDPNDLGAYIYCTSEPTGSSNSDMGVVNASSQGISICARRATNDNMSIRLASGVTTAISADGDTFGGGLSGASRFDGVSVTGSHNGVTKNTVSLASVALPALPIYLLAHNANGAVSAFSPRRQAFCYIGRGLTPAQETELTAAVGEYLEACAYGHAYIEEVGVGTEVINVDFIAYGFTPQSVLSCLQAARNGLSVALVGGWRDRFNFGGMSSGGLGFGDVLSTAAFGGLVRYLIRRIKTIGNQATEQYYFEPRWMQWALRELLTPEKNGGFQIPIYQTNGVLSVQKTGTEVTSFTTVDGRTFNIKGGVDNSYEIDFARAAGCSTRIGREAATGASAESFNGVRATFNEYPGVDPWKTPGVPASGLINLLTAVRSTFTPALNTLAAAGTADNKTQAYNFRMTMTNSARWRRPLPTTPPPGYDVADYEILLRFMAANPTKTSFFDYFKADAFYTGAGESKFDVNNRAGPAAPSTDFIGKSWAYPTSPYSAREAIWKAHWNWIMGMLYLMQHGTDPRIPAALKTNCLAWGFCADHYFSPHENDIVNMNPQLYVREASRLDGVAKLLGDELKRNDGGVPSISTNTVSMISYFMDSHGVEYIAVEKTAGTWLVAGEGGFGEPDGELGGTDGMFPLPLEVCTPKPTECTNIFVSFGISASHIGFGAGRMEFTAMQTGQSLGQIAAEAINNNRIFQDTANYPAARTALLANAFALTNEPAPILAQTT